ncbi:MAG TPA: phospholipase D-like domain-containing protein [bacterium]|nr:phospholipase D-like domain-containing protein [bacterium]HOL34533.1 phospholipase D-like domain-containing protein [bacterium]HPP07519.1 phospholipase D-like domain-containing protein [bacterium]
MKNIFKIFFFCALTITSCIYQSLALCAPAEVEPITNQYYLPKVMELIGNAETSINVMMYNMTWYEKYPDSPSNKLIDSLCKAARKKINVTVILNIDKPGFVKDSDSNIHTARILKNSGVKVLLDPVDQTTHAKLIIVDNRFVVVGSFNWSYYSLEKNNETAVIIDSKEIASYFLKYFNSVAIRSSPAITSD